LNYKAVSPALFRGQLAGRMVQKTEDCDEHWEIAGTIGDFLAKGNERFWWDEETYVRFDPNPEWKPLMAALSKANPAEDLRATGSFLPDGSLVGLSMHGNYTSKLDITPLSGLKLKTLSIIGSGISDLRPLKGLPLESLTLSFSWALKDLSPISELSLKALDLSASHIEALPARLPATLTRLKIGGCSKLQNLEALKGLPLRELDLYNTEIQDLSILKALPLKVLSLHGALLEDVGFLKGMPLTELDLSLHRVTDLSPIKGMPLQKLGLYTTVVTDLTPLKGMPLREMRLANNHQITSLEGLQVCPWKTWTWSSPKGSTT
jgi:hypothetical protein